MKYEGNALTERELIRPEAKEASILFSVVVVLFFTIGFRAQRMNQDIGLLITEYVLILLPVIVFLLAYKYDIKSVLRLNKIKPISLLIIFFSMIAAIPVVGVFNALNLWLVDRLFGKVYVAQPVIGENIQGLFLSIFIIAVTPAICEEILFRGTIQRSFERFGTAKAILASSLLFGLIHVDFQKLFGTFLLGALIGFFVYRSNSLFAGMFAHFTNNGIAVFLTYLSSKLSQMIKASGIDSVTEGSDMGGLFDSLENMPPMQLMAFIAVWAFIFLFCLAALAGLLFAFIKTLPAKNYMKEAAPVSAKKTVRTAFLMLIPGLVIIAFVYLNEGLMLVGINDGFVYSAFRLITGG